MMRAILALHRFLASVSGLILTIWCLSGFVMMYQSFPELTDAERLRGLMPINFDYCENIEQLPIRGDVRLTDARIEMTAGIPILRLSLKGGQTQLFNLATVKAKAKFNDVETEMVAGTYGARVGLNAELHRLGTIGLDQWTVQMALRNRPIHHFAFDDPDATHIYVSGTSGEVFQQTTRRERMLSWIGAVPHWLYPTAIRQHLRLWTEVVIWIATLGIFLTATGLYVGILQLRTGQGQRRSPYKGLWFWHHMTGLVFGILTLTWVTSGLLTMNPWGLLQDNTIQIRSQLAGEATWAEMRAALLSVPASSFVVRIQAEPLADKVLVLTSGSDNVVRTFNSEGHPTIINRADIERSFLRAGLGQVRFDLIEREDTYYYGHHGTVALPVWRARLADPRGTLIYIDAKTGKIIRVVDAASRGSRWLSSAFHDFDWPWIRGRPVWDLMVLPLLLGVTVSCGIGTWLSFSRIGRDARAFGARMSPKSEVQTSET